LLGGVQRFFLNVICRRAKNRWMALTAAVTPTEANSAALISSSVISGCWSTRSSKKQAWASSGDRLGLWGTGAMLPIVFHRCTHRIAVAAPISNLPAASRRDNPPSTALMTRSRRSVE
jgi:hypothetical protein